MAKLPSPSAGATTTDVFARLKVDGSDAVDGTGGAVGVGAIEFGELIAGPPGSPGVVRSNTPPADTTLLWVDTSTAP